MRNTALLSPPRSGRRLRTGGVSWRLIPVSNRTTVRSLAVDSDGRVYFGAIGELGYLVPDPSGRTEPVSLLEHVPEPDRDFADVWKTYALGDGVYFQSFDRLFHWRDGRMEVWRPETRFFAGHAAGGRFFLQTCAAGWSCSTAPGSCGAS